MEKKISLVVKEKNPLVIGVEEKQLAAGALRFCFCDGLKPRKPADAGVDGLSQAAAAADRQREPGVIWKWLDGAMPDGASDFLKNCQKVSMRFGQFSNSSTSYPKNIQQNYELHHVWY